MDKKKIAIGIVALVVIILAAFVFMGSTVTHTVDFKYDKYFGVSVPENFEMVNSSGGVDYCLSPDKSYIVDINELDDVNPKNMESTFKRIKNDKDLGLKNTKSYKVDTVKAYDFTVTKSDKNEEYVKSLNVDNAKYSRIVAFVIPGAKKVYVLKVYTNDSSVDLHSQEIDDLVESVGDYHFFSSD